MRYINQNDYDYVLYPVNTGALEEEQDADDRCCTFADAGCGLAAAIMVADRLLVEPDFGIKEALQLAYLCEANHIPGTDYKRYAPAFAKQLGLKYAPSNSTEELLRCLRTGGAAVLHSAGDRAEDGYIGVFTHGGHFLTAISVEEDGRIAILDPSLRDAKYEEPGRCGKVEVRRKLCLAEADVVARDCEHRDPAYYLFWRG